jgi:hypothetical protein
MAMIEIDVFDRINWCHCQYHVSLKVYILWIVQFAVAHWLTVPLFVIFDSLAVVLGGHGHSHGGHSHDHDHGHVHEGEDHHDHDHDHDHEEEGVSKTGAKKVSLSSNKLLYN